MAFNTMKKKGFGKFMKKMIPFFSFCFLCLLFIGSTFAEMSDKEKVEFIESLAEPSKEKKVFYRWQSETARQNLIETGEMTPELHTYFMKQINNYSGAGFYISEDMASSSSFGDTLMQVEIEPGYKLLDLMDPKIQKKLKENGISNDEIFHIFHLKVGVKDTRESGWWVLKAKEGVKFKPFSSQATGLSTLSEAYEKIEKEKQKAFFKSSVKEDILKRAETNSFVLESPFVEILEEEHGHKYVKDAVNRHMASRPPIRTAGEGMEIFLHAGKYLSKHERTKIRGKITTLPIENAEVGVRILQKIGPHLSEKNQTKIANKIAKLPIQTVEEGIEILSLEDQYFSGAEKAKIADKIPIKNAQEGEHFLRAASQYLSEKQKTKIVDKIPFETAEQGAHKLFYLRDYLSKREQNKISNKITTLPIETVGEGREIFLYARHYLSEDEAAKILDKIPFKNVSEGVKILENEGFYLSDANKTKIVEKTLPFVTSEEELEQFERYLSDSEYKDVHKKFQARAQTPINGKNSSGNSNGNISDTSERVKCLKKWLSKI